MYVPCTGPIQGSEVEGSTAQCFTLTPYRGPVGSRHVRGVLPTKTLLYLDPTVSYPHPYSFGTRQTRTRYNFRIGTVKDPLPKI